MYAWTNGESSLRWRSRSFAFRVARSTAKSPLEVCTDPATRMLGPVLAKGPGRVYGPRCYLAGPSLKVSARIGAMPIKSLRSILLPGFKQNSDLMIDTSFQTTDGTSIGVSVSVPILLRPPPSATVSVWRSGNALFSIIEVNLRGARLVLRWVTVSAFDSRRTHFISVCN